MKYGEHKKNSRLPGVFAVKAQTPGTSAFQKLREKEIRAVTLRP